MSEIAVAAMPEIAEVAALYADCGYGGGVGEVDTTLVARVNGRLVGAVRLCPQDGVVVLRGMQVHHAFQRQGIGSQLLLACIPFLNTGASFCLPFAHLVSFYRVAGFRVAPPAQLPTFLVARLSSYLARGQDVLAMQRVPPNPLFERTATGKPVSAAQRQR